MKIVSLDVHAESSQLVVIDEQGELMFELKVPTRADSVRAIVAGIPGPKKVVFEEGPMSAMLHDALKDVCDEVSACNPAHNALIALSEDSNDERDARRLARLARNGALKEVYAAPEPYRSLRGLLGHEQQIQQRITTLKNRIRGLCRRHCCDSLKRRVYARRRREEVLSRFTDESARWQVESLFREMDLLVRERAGVTRQMKRLCAGLPELEWIDSIPGVGAITTRTLVGWIADPHRFESRSKGSSYAGLGIGQGITNWKPVGRARASRRGNRQVKRVLMIAAKSASISNSALGRRYGARMRDGWDANKAYRDLGRKIFRLALALWRNRCRYDDKHVSDVNP